MFQKCDDPNAPLKEFTDGADTTLPGNEFHLLLRNSCRVLVWKFSYFNLNSWPLKPSRVCRFRRLRLVSYGSLAKPEDLCCSSLNAF
ncbi:hypothetical protein NQ315_006631 [Exocentrus adspersus]|uniref:Uncharacterized protein n=1 Tax=Exocentrus adspersus TaxID=1586481 RepID=A0AAV8VEL3_9CUCU|nr:hypothetical protein NQ315_006631 [Exocentrus adspersus]